MALHTYKSGKWMMKSYGEEIDLSPYVQQEIFDADQSRQDSEIAGERAINETQDNQINALETQIQLLAQAKATGSWTYQRNISGSIRPPATKTFYGTDINDAVNNVLNDWSNLRLIMIDKTSIEGSVFTFSAFEEGDKIEILSKDGTNAVYGTVTNNPNNDGYGNFLVAVERSSGGPVEGAEYLVSAYRPGANSGDVDLDILDGRYLVKTGGTMTGNLTLDTGSGLYTKEIIKSTRNTGYAFQVKPDDTDDATAFIHTNGSASFGATSFYDVISFSGDSRIKALDGDGNETFKLYPSGLMDTKGEIRIDRQGTTQGFVVRQNGTPKLTIRADGRATSEYAVTSGDDANVLTTKEYVDDAVAANSGSDYELPTATTSVKGGVKAAQTSGTYVGCTMMDGEHMGVRQSSNVHKGVNYKGQCCVTGNSTPSASEYQQGCMIFSTATNSVYIRT